MASSLQRFATSLSPAVMTRGPSPSLTTMLAIVSAVALLVSLRKRTSGGGPSKYRGTQGGEGMTFEEAVMKGLAPNGGLFVPQAVPVVNNIAKWKDLTFHQLAFEIMSLYVPGETCTAEQLKDLIARSYNASNFRSGSITPLVALKHEHVEILELFHGPTWAFKDVALQFLGNLFEHILARKQGDEARITIMGATSGDTGSAAIQGVRGKKGVYCFMLFPEGRVSAIQERQMTTILDRNVQCLAIRGTFDDAQDLVKAAFKDESFRAKHRLAAVNSINWARILAQITYYFQAYFDLRRQGKNVQRLIFVVPTGNFGDVLAGYYAKRMGLPVERFVVATNENDILHRFFTTGTYARRDVQPTITPSMDICVSSNFERFLFHMLGENPTRIQTLMKEFNQNKEFSITQAELQKCREVMWSTRATEVEVSGTIKRVYEADNYLLDPHTAVGVCGAAELRRSGLVNDSHTVVCLATAHWAKFTPAVSAAAGAEAVKKNYPKELTALEGMPVKKIVIDADLGKIKSKMEEVMRQ